nr:helix-turn-helix transcriptional regulator [Solobacterium sp.]
MNFGEKVKNARIAKNWSQSDLAKQAGISLRTIQNYESGERLPKKKETYAKLADVLEIEENTLLDENASFVLKAYEEYGDTAMDQARKLVSDVKALWAGGRMDPEDMDIMMQAMQEAYWDAKKKNRKYAGK